MQINVKPNNMFIRTSNIIFLQLLWIILTTTNILSDAVLSSSDLRKGSGHELQMSKVNVSSEFICSTETNTSIIWEKTPSGPLIYSLARVNPDVGKKFVMNSSNSPFILTLLESRLSDAGVYRCKPEGNERHIKLLTYIVIESELACDMRHGGAGGALTAWCSMTYAGGTNLLSVKWFYKICDSLKLLNSSLIFPITKTINEAIINNSTVILPDAVIGSYLMCQFEFALPNAINASKFTFNWTSPEVLQSNMTFEGESEPVGDTSQNEEDATVKAWCSMTYVGNSNQHTVKWFLQNCENIILLKASFSSTISEAINETVTINSTISVPDFINGSQLICRIQNELSNYSNDAFNFSSFWKSSAILLRSQTYTTEQKLKTTSSDFSSHNPDAEPSQSFKFSDTSEPDTRSIFGISGRTSEGSITPVSSHSAEPNWLVIGMTVAFVAIVLLLIVVIICMYAYFRSKTAASRRRRAESSYAMTLPPELPRSHSYEKIEPIYNEASGYRGSIISSHSYNYPSRNSLDTFDAPPLPERDIAPNKPNVGKKIVKWASEITSNDDGASNVNLIGPGEYLRMPTDSRYTNRAEHSDGFGYTLLPGDYGQTPVSLSEMLPELINSGNCHGKTRTTNDGYEYPIPSIYDGHTEEQNDPEKRDQSTSFVIQNQENMKDSGQLSTTVKKDEYTKIIHKEDHSYEKPLPEAADDTRYFPLIKTLDDDLKFSYANVLNTNTLATQILVPNSTSENVCNSAEASVKREMVRKYLELIEDV